ncbi:MAG: hypothetical protein RR948_05625 [Clostridium sp.]|uniref:hypothetical protein n=1 Tax=Clostridium sp. TaxID=1506 RepID=UPI0030491907
MRYFLEYDKDKKVVGWLTKNTSPTSPNLVEVEPRMFKEELLSIGVTYELEEDKIKRLEEEKAILESCVIELGNLQSKETENRVVLENAILELANSISIGGK